MTFWENLKHEDNKSFTANGSEAYKSTGDYLVDFIGAISTYRKSPENEIQKWIDILYSEDKLSARKLVFYVRDILQGMGERRIARNLWYRLAHIDPENMALNIKNIPEFGRFDDLYSLIDTPIENKMWDFVKDKYNEDLENMKNKKPVSGLGKWLKSPNSKVKSTRNLGRLAAKKLGLNFREFARNLTNLRKYLDVVELKMTDNQWDKINYPNVPSQAALRYKNAFMKRDKERYENFISDVSAGKSSIKATTLYPYDIIKTVFNGDYDNTAEVLWKNLPDFILDKDKNILTVCDVSGSMVGTPMAVAIGLTLYFSEKTESEFRNKFITFSSRPELIEIPDTCKTIKDKVNFTKRANWSQSTNLAATLDLILNACKLNKKSTPAGLLIITDMQFDSYSTYGWNATLFEEYKNKFKAAGLTIPNIIFWNCAGRVYKGNFQTNANTKGVQYVSGMSPSIFANILKNLYTTPYEAAMNIINSERYSVIK